MLHLKVILVLAVAICAIVADPIRQKPLRNRILARQQIQPNVASAGYPPAGVTPSTPFDLPTETEQPDTVYGPPEIEEAAQPDNVYGPPEIETQQPDTVYGPPEVETQEPDSVYGPPDAQTEQPDLIYGPPETDANTVEGEAKIESSQEETVEEAEDLDEVEEEVLLDEDGSIIAISTTFGVGNTETKPARLVYQRFPQSRQQPTAVPARLTKGKILRPSNVVYTARYQKF